MLSFIYVLVALNALLLFANGLSVSFPDDIILPTYKSNLQYEGTQFLKRVRNDSLHLTLVYSVTDLVSSVADLKWQLNDQDLTVEKPAKNSLLYEILTYDESTKTMKVELNLKDSSARGGVYKLTVANAGVEAFGQGIINSAPILPVYSKPKRVLQGDALRISCKVEGYPVATAVEWLFAKITVDLSDDKAAINDASRSVQPIDFSDPIWADFTNITSEDGTSNDTLRFIDLKVEHNGLYACKVENSLGNDTTLMLVAVKDRWAALWPFIGIVIEVTVLVAAILLYERHQMRAKPANNSNAADTNAIIDVASPNGLSNDKNPKSEEIRLRNSAKL